MLTTILLYYDDPHFMIETREVKLPAQIAQPAYSLAGIWKPIVSIVHTLKH